MKKILAVLLSTSIILGSGAPANAYEHDKHDQHDRHDRRSEDTRRYAHDNYDYNRHDRDEHRHRRHNDKDGWGVAFGILAAGAALAIANDQPAYAAPQPVYVQPQPVYVERTYRPVTVAQTVYEPHTVYTTTYQPEYRQLNYADMY